MRVNLYWNLVATAEPADPRDPGDPAYDWTAIDTAVGNAGEHDLSVLLTVLSAPAWAEGLDRPADGSAPVGTWRPDPAAFGDFAHAVATRYSGDVEYFSAWNEPNIATYLTPQFEDGENVSAAIYSGLLNEFYDEVKAVDPGARVVTAGTAPFGDQARSRRTSPLEFWRGVLCVGEDGEEDDCPSGGARFDVLAHHPIVFPPGPPDRSYPDPDDIGVADFDRLVALLRRAEELGTVEPAGSHDVIVPELWWETDPPQLGGVGVADHARYLVDALEQLRADGAEGVWFLQLRDYPVVAGERIEGSAYAALRSYQTGVFTTDGEPKPAYEALREYSASRAK